MPGAEGGEAAANELRETTTGQFGWWRGEQKARQTVDGGDRGVVSEITEGVG